MWRVERTLVAGRRFKADVHCARLADGRRVAVKDFSGRGRLERWWGRLQISREAAALAALAGVPGVPRLVGRLGSCTLAVEWIDGRPLHDHRRAREPAETLAALEAILARIHARGVVHNDLRGRENVLLTEQPPGLAIVDWAAAVRLPPGTWRHRLLFPLWRRVDDGGWLKWKRMLDPDRLSRTQRAALRRFERWRRLWPFNRKPTGRVPDEAGR